MNPQKIVISVVLTVAVVGGIIYLNSQKAPRNTSGGRVDVPTTMGKEEKEKLYSVAKEITTPDSFINTDGKPVTIGELIGKKVVLIDFWTYSCINCQRTTPYLNTWYEKYKDKGLVIIGLHTPEFEFEKVYQNVLEATKRLGIKYPVVLDNDYSTWNAYQNRFWPRKYLIDIDGYVVYDHIGEGGYEETEKKIQELLQERADRLQTNKSITQEITQPKNLIERSQGGDSPEVYFGSQRNELLGNGTRFKNGIQNFSTPETIPLNQLFLTGQWDIQPEYAANATSPAAIRFRYKAKDVYFVASAKQPVPISIKQDGKLLDTKITVQEDRLYKIIENQAVGEHTLELMIETPGLKAFTFTFG